MRASPRQPLWLGEPGKATRTLCGMLVGLSVLIGLSGRTGGLSAADLALTPDAVWRAESWRLFTYAVIEVQPLSLILNTLVLYLFGNYFEARWGTQNFLRFVALVIPLAALLAIPLSWFVDTIPLIHDNGAALGPAALLDALLVAYAVTSPDARVMFGFVLPVTSKQVIGIILLFQILAALLTGTTDVSITLAGMLMGYLLTTGLWQPKRLHKLWRTRRMHARLRVVPKNYKVH